MPGTYRVFRPEIWSAFIQKAFHNKLYAASFFKDYSADVAAGGDVVHIPQMALSTAGTLTFTTGAITDNLVADTRSVLNISTWAYKSRKFSDAYMAQVASNYGLQAAYAENIAMAVKTKLDTDILTQGSTVQLHTGTSASNINNTAIQASLQIAESYSMPLSEMAFFFHGNAYWGELLRGNLFSNAADWGKAVAGSGQNYPIATLFGIPVYVTAQVPACSGIGTDGYPTTSHRNLLIHPRTIAYAVGNLPGGMPRVQVLPVGDALAHRVIADLLYGVKGTDGNGGVRIISNT